MIRWTLRLWPFYAWVHVGTYTVFSQGGRWYDRNEKPGSKEWRAAPPRHLNKGFAIRLGVTWSVRETYRNDDRNFPAEDLVLGDKE